ncbi:MAG TPA: glycosyltransferase family 87 protein [Acidobacteriaceae bacterium]
MARSVGRTGNDTTHGPGSAGLPRTWLLLWSTLLVIAAVNAVACYPLLSGDAGLLLSVVLAGAAALQIIGAPAVLGSKNAGLAWVALLLFVFSQLLQWSNTRGLPPVNRSFDFSAYYLAGQAVADQRHAGLYFVPTYADGRMNLNVPVPLASVWGRASVRGGVPFAAPFIYPPFVAILMEPFGYLSFASACAVWRLVTVLAAAGAMLLALSAGGIAITRRLALLLGVGLFSYYPFLDGLWMGQIDCVILLLLAAGVWLLGRRQDLMSALCFAAATLIKLTPVLVLPVLIFHRRWRWLAAWAGWMGALLCCSLWRAGWAMHRQFWHQVLPGIGCGAPLSSNSSLVAYVQELLLGHVYDWASAPHALPPHACAVSRGVAGVMYVAMLVRFYRRRGQADLRGEICLALLLTLVVSPISWWHHYALALLPCLYLWSSAREWRLWTLTALVLALGTNLPGFGLLLTEQSAAQLVLAAMVPALTLAVVYLGAAPGRRAAVQRARAHVGPAGACSWAKE